MSSINFFFSRKYRKFILRTNVCVCVCIGMCMCRRAGMGAFVSFKCIYVCVCMYRMCMCSYAVCVCVRIVCVRVYVCVHHMFVCACVWLVPATANNDNFCLFQSSDCQIVVVGGCLSGCLL